MRLIINTASLFSGGGVQVGLSFIEECKKFKENEYHIFLCEALERQIDQSQFDSNFSFYSIARRRNPIKNILYLQKYLSNLEERIHPDCVFTVFGPSYWTPKAPHIVGFATGHYIYNESPYWKKISLLQTCIWKLKKKLHIYFYKKNSTYFHVETKDAKERLVKLFKTDKNNIYVVSNTYSQFFDTPINTENKLLPDNQAQLKRFLILSAYYPHKNIEILNQVISILIDKNVADVQFITTLHPSIYDQVFLDDIKPMILNVGSIDAAQCPQLYHECDFLLLPTLLETFSANYPEAMKMNKPIITSDLSFARDICRDAALFVNPTDAKDIAEKILLLINDRNLQSDLINKGHQRLTSFPSSKERAKMYLFICQSLANKR